MGIKDALQSRIHVALRYGELGQKAKKKVWGMFLDMVLKSEQADSDKTKPITSSSTDPDDSTSTNSDSASTPASNSTVLLETTTEKEKEALKALFSEEDVDSLSKKNLNGRQIKNVVRTAQALAKSRGTRMGMKEVKKVLEVSESFENDLRGTGRLDGMHAYA